MTTTEHLARIRAKCVELLEIAEKRTPGKWETPEETPWDVWTPDSHCVASCGPKRDYAFGLGSSLCNSRFIAACAGPAEAGWRSTIVAIDDLQSTINVRGLAYHEEALANEILAAWPEETLL